MREYMDNRVRILDWTSRGSSVTPAHSCHRGLFARIRIRNSFRLTAKPAPDAGGTTSNLKAVGSNPIRRASDGSSKVEHQECLATVCRRCYLPFGYNSMTDWITIDGSEGEGGGQILRTALALSLVTGRPFRIEGIRAGRSKPGLLRQHLTAVNAAVAVGAAEVEGATLASPDLVFRPRAVKPGEYR